MITISNSEMATWLRCRRKWYVNYFLAYQPAELPLTGPAPLGTKVHTALEGYYGYELNPLGVLDLLYSAEVAARPDLQPELDAEHQMAQIMVEGYLEWLSETGTDAEIEVVATEREVVVALPSVPGVALRSRLDQSFLHLPSSTAMFMDYKTGADFERADHLENDPQMKFYAVVSHLEAASPRPGAPEPMLVGGGAVTSLRRVKRSDRARPPFYRRDYFRYNPDQVTAAYAKITSVAREIVATRQQLTELAARTGNQLEAVNAFQRGELRPTWISRDCSWSCPLSSGLCASMDDGSDWPSILTSSGHFSQTDPYAYYSMDALRSIRALLTEPQ